MTTFSVIVTARDAQGYLREGLEALRTAEGHPAGDLEVIVVDNGSADSTRAIADEYAERDDRFSAVHLPERLPEGQARDAGARTATESSPARARSQTGQSRCMGATIVRGPGQKALANTMAQASMATSL